MKKLLLGLAAAFCLALTPAAAFAEESEAELEDTAYYLQGIDDVNIIWTVGLDFSNEYGVVNLQIPDENGEYLDENSVTVLGAMTVTDTSIIITDEEDGADYEFGMDTADEEGTQFKMTYEPTNSEVVLSFIDPDTVESDDSFVYYAGFDEDGVQWTVGFDFDNSAIAVNVSKDDQDITMAGVFEDNGTDTLTVTWEDGTVEELGYEFLDEDGRTLKLTSDDVSFVVSYIDSSVFDDLAA